MLNLCVRIYCTAIRVLECLKDLPPLIFRLILAYGFYGPAMEKFNHPEGTIQFFRSLGIPHPEINYYMAMSTELSGTFLIALGLATRLMTIPMSVVMLVAISTVHWANGFAACQCHAEGGPKFGYEIALYFLCMLFFLLVYGPGRISIDHLIKKATEHRKPRTDGWGQQAKGQ